MARVLIVGCGCRGRALAAALAEAGHAVRGSTRDEARLRDIEAAGAEPTIGDPDRLATLLPSLAGVSVVCWLMGSAAPSDVNGARLKALTEKLVDTPVRGLVYEGRGTAQPEALDLGAAIVAAAAETHRMHAEVVRADPADHGAWLGAMRAAVARVLSA